MPLYETVMQEKPAVVLEIGNAYTKLGFAAEAFPRHIIPSTITDTMTKVTKNILQSTSDIELYDQIVEFVNKLFFKHILVSPKDRRIVIVETVFTPTQFRETLAKVLFRHFEVASVLFVPTHLVVLATLAIDTALVVDLGYKEAIVVPVYSGVQVLHAWEAQNLAAEAVHSEIRRQLIATGVDESLLAEDIVEDIKVRTCFVTKLDRAIKHRDENPPPAVPDVEYPVRGDRIITIPGSVRETAFEALFPEDNDHLGLPHIILEAILKCPSDMRRELLENIVVIGGTSMVTGLMARLKSELLAQLSSDLYKDRIFLKTVKFHSVPAKSNFTAWLGGSIYGGTDLIGTRSLTKEVFTKHSRVPDWPHLEDNRAPGSV